MLGHRLWTELSGRYETWTTVRGRATLFPDHPDFNRAYVVEHVDARVWHDLVAVLAKVQPDVVINCIGLIKQHPLASDPILSLETNALLPHRLALLCQASGARLIHISTDCVFSGAKGNYTEEDISDAQDLYGRSKYLGETSAPNAITLRTSIIGPELYTQYGLLAWFLSQQQAVKGFKKAIFSGFTTDELSRIIADYVIPNPTLTGLYHVSSDPISKYDLLTLFNEFYQRGLTITPQSDFVCDRSLNSNCFRNAVSYTPPAWPIMIEAMAQKHRPYHHTDKDTAR